MKGFKAKHSLLRSPWAEVSAQLQQTTHNEHQTSVSHMQVYKDSHVYLNNHLKLHKSIIIL